ncbi:hypothetical protein WISP_111309 [Willisornis vidua]|uniref:Uncharacterized protein n=1 Tax=Willisornis vidua TaxID=1566151 RepID=A0ABQ9D1D5_9PASS|nr:hypothetical protein WISP_111309 [Willisornis vidua]
MYKGNPDRWIFMCLNLCQLPFVLLLDTTAMTLIELVTYTAKAAAFNTFFSSVSSNTVGPLDLRTKIHFDVNTDPPPVKEELVCE